jgi:hypothetical protein
LSSAYEFPTLLEAGHLLAGFLEDIDKSGLAGRPREAIAVYLALTSRVLEEPVSVVVKGQSSSGKSFLVKKVLAFFPPDAIIERSSLSGSALKYTDEDLRHRVIVLAEVSGLDENGMYAMRTLLSEGRLSHEAVVTKMNGERGTQIVEKEGPTSFVLTTTEPFLFHDNETRLISIELDDSRAVIEAGLDALAAPPVMLPEMEEWVTRQRELGGDGVPDVVVPFVREIVEAIKKRSGPLQSRMMRDVSKVVRLIEACALLHRSERELDEAGRVIATFDDYELVRWAVGPFLDDGLGADVPRQVVEVVDVVQKGLAAGSPFVTQRDVAERLNWDKSTASRWVRKAVEASHLENQEPNGRAKGYRLVLGAPLPADEGTLLPPVERLRA